MTHMSRQVRWPPAGRTGSSIGLEADHLYPRAQWSPPISCAPSCTDIDDNEIFAAVMIRGRQL